MLPKSLHTVRILAAVAAQLSGMSGDTLARVLQAAAIIGYPDASAADPLIAKAAAAIAKSVQS